MSAPPKGAVFPEAQPPSKQARECFARGADLLPQSDNRSIGSSGDRPQPLLRLGVRYLHPPADATPRQPPFPESDLFHLILARG